MKKTALLHRLVTVAGLATALLPISVLAASGDLYEADPGSDMILKFTPAGTQSPFVSGLSGPFGLAFDSSGNLFEADLGSGTIFEFTPAGIKSTFASGLNGPIGLAFDSPGNLFEADQGSGTIFKFAPDGTKSTFASGLSAPSGLAFEGALSSGPTVHLANISTRALVQTGNNVLIGGFVISGNNPKQVLVRAMGPSLPAVIPNRMQDPMISLHDSTTAEIDSDDDWQSHPNAGQIPMSLQPGDPRESAIFTTLQPGGYTAIVSGKGGTTGVA